MSKHRATAGARMRSAPDIVKLLEQYGCRPIEFTGTPDALYDRHLLFDNVVDPAVVGARERYEAVARSVRDVVICRSGCSEAGRSGGRAARTGDEP